MTFLKQSTAATIKMGPFVDNTDGVTAETGLTISQADIRLSKNGGAFAQSNDATGATHDENGYYGVPLDATDTGTLGRLRVAINESGALPVWQDFMIIPANVFDSLISGSDYLDVHASELSDDVITSAKFDETTAFPLKSADSGSTQIARTGADGDTLETLSDQIDGVCSLGSGAIEWVYNLVDENTDPIADANIWVTTDEAGTNVIASGTTDSFGNVTFYLDAGTIYVWGQKDGYDFSNPDTEVVS